MTKRLDSVSSPNFIHSRPPPSMSVHTGHPSDNVRTMFGHPSDNLRNSLFDMESATRTPLAERRLKELCAHATVNVGRTSKDVRCAVEDDQGRRMG